MFDHLAALSALCSPAGTTAGGFVLGGMLLAGLAGSVVHCSFMCGPFVLAQVGARLQTLPVARMCEGARLRQAMLLPYHAGRILTYAALGAAAAALNQTAGLWLARSSSWLLMLGGLLFMVQAARRLWPGARWPTLAHGGITGWHAAMRRMAARIDVTRTGGAFLLGLLLGGLPCGFLYSAVAVAAASASPAGGAVALVAFGLGTVPALVVVGIAGYQAGRVWNNAVARLAPIALLANGTLLMVMAARSLAL